MVEVADHLGEGSASLRQVGAQARPTPLTSRATVVRNWLTRLPRPCNELAKLWPCP